MAGMFYSLDEVIEKLGKNANEINKLVKDGKLREFRDGAKQLYKVEDVDALANVPKGDTAVLEDSMQLNIDETGELSLAPEELEALSEEQNGSEAGESAFKLDETGELMADDILADEPQDEVSLDDDIQLDDNEDNEDSAVELKPAEQADENTKENISTGDTSISLSGDSINVLSDSDQDFKISDDTSGETKLLDDEPKALDDDDQMSIDRLDDDVNLESFGGSGSGLLDLSLQADDTSLGAVLDDIYPETSGDAQPGAAADAGTPANGLAAEADNLDNMFDAPAEPQGLGEAADLDAAGAAALPQEMPASPIAAAAAISEIPPDSASNIFGITMFIPLIVLIYSAIVVLSGFKFIPELKALSSLEPIIWYVAAGLAGVVVLMAVIAAASGKPASPKVKKEKKAKAPKKTKPKKEKKAKKGK